VSIACEFVIDIYSIITKGECDNSTGVNCKITITKELKFVVNNMFWMNKILLFLLCCRSVDSDADKCVSSPGIDNATSSSIELWNICDNWVQERVCLCCLIFLEYSSSFRLVKHVGRLAK